MIKIKELREKAGLKQGDVAEKLDISIANYSKKENGIIKFSIEEANVISKLFNKSIDEIFLS